ncbi:type II toxin-antitoxin system HicB family antitoxin [Synechocystis salina LEGE 06155]|nr:type II toxin-antitoxin system HicB family antitoxin [Synechocystis salina LEGE 06155]
MVNVDHYIYKVIWSSQDQEFVGLCAEFPSLSFLHEDRHQALEGITSLVKEVIVDMEQNGEIVPEPITDRQYSGRFQVRINPDLHRRLAMEAAEEKVSLNRYISYKLGV